MTKKLTTSAMMIALSAVLSLITVYKAAYGGIKRYIKMLQSGPIRGTVNGNT